MFACGCSAPKEESGAYFVEFSISSNFYAEGEKLSAGGSGALKEEVGSM